VSAESLKNYLPRENSLPALYHDPGGKDNISEREILYKVLFDMRKDVNDLKKIVLDGFANPDEAAQILKNNASLFEGVQHSTELTNSEHVVLNIPSSQVVQQPDVNEEVQDISHVAEDDSLSIEKKEKELILRALNKNNNKRKYAARDLGISERTLYRKIKEYQLEE
jgi:ActR/RegA family two-component response regulator